MAQNALADGFVRICVDPSLNYYDGKCRIITEGQYIPGDISVTADVPVLVTSKNHVVKMFGEGSQLSIGLETIFCSCPENAEVYALPRQDPSGGVKAVYTLTVTGTATGPGRMDIFLIEDRFSISIPVDIGDTPTDIAAAIVSALPDDFPYTATAALGVVTLTAVNAGLVGNYLSMVYNWTGRINRAPAGVSIALVQTTPGSGALTVLDLESVLGNCCYDVFALLGEGTAYQSGWEAYLSSIWDCSKPQCFGHGYLYVKGSHGQIMSQASNSAEVSKVAHCEAIPIPPWMIVSAYAGLSVCTACSNPELSIQGREYGVLGCLKYPQSCVSCFSFPEQLELQAEGFVVYGPLEGGSGQLTSPYIYNDVTNNLTDDYGRPNPTYRDVSSKRLIGETAVQIAEHLQSYSALGLFTKNTDIPTGIFGTNPNMIQADTRTWMLERVGILFSEFDDINKDVILQTDFQVKPPCQGVPGKLHLFTRYRPPVRIDGISVNMQPKLLDNCVR